jgi:hypothetical protein
MTKVETIDFGSRPVMERKTEGNCCNRSDQECAMDELNYQPSTRKEEHT